MIIRRVLLLLLVAMGLVIVGASVILSFLPRTSKVSAQPFERTPLRVERGRYLVDAVLGCMDCHSRHDLTRFGKPAVGLDGAGGDCFDGSQGFPGTLCMANITPEPETGIGAWTDAQILRAIREGVDNKGRGLFPLMPYLVYRALSDEDGKAVVAYLRTLPPAKNTVPDTKIGFPTSLALKLAPERLKGPVSAPDHNDRVAHGRYLAIVSGCHFCHTPVDNKQQPRAGLDFSGGREFRGPWGVLRSSNLTPHATGLGDRNEQAFVGMFKAFDIPADQVPKVPLAQNTEMPWLSRARMSAADLGAIHAFLKTVRPLERAIEKRTRPPLPSADAGTAAPAAP